LEARPHFTAWFVSQGTLAAMHVPPFADEKDAATFVLRRRLADAAAQTRFLYRLIDRLPYRLQYRIGEMMTSAGRLRHFYLRKKEIAHQVRILIENGAGQVVVLGAGLDVLASQLANEYPRLHFIEIDREGSQRFKKEALHGMLPANVELVSGNLDQPLSAVMSQSKLFRAGLPTVWVAESFFFFFLEKDVVRIMGDIGQLSAQGSYLLFTTIPPRKHGNFIGRHLQNLLLSKAKSPFEWMIYADKISSFLNNTGYELASQIDCAALHKRYMWGKFLINNGVAEDIHIAKTKKV
jgi:methyltransferase (TIGR00027 family)